MLNFFKKNKVDKQELELYKEAQKRIKRKKSLYSHFSIFIISAISFYIANIYFEIGKNIVIFSINWHIIITLFWLILLVYHFTKVFFFPIFMNKEWEEKQINKLVKKQRTKINEIKKEMLEELKVKASNELLESSIKKVNLTVIVAAGKNNEIGKDNDLIWHLSNDLKRFKSLTSGNTIIMGRKTFESFPKPLPNRKHIVITRQEQYKVPNGIVVVNSLEEALRNVLNDKQPFIIGGGEIYKQSIKYASTIELTRVKGTFDNADTFFVDLDDNWKIINQENYLKEEKHNESFMTLIYACYADDSATKSNV